MHARRRSAVHASMHPCMRACCTTRCTRAASPQAHTHGQHTLGCMHACSAHACAAAGRAVAHPWLRLELGRRHDRHAWHRRRHKHGRARRLLLLAAAAAAAGEQPRPPGPRLGRGVWCCERAVGGFRNEAVKRRVCRWQRRRAGRHRVERAAGLGDRRVAEAALWGRGAHAGRRLALRGAALAKGPPGGAVVRSRWRGARGSETAAPARTGATSSSGELPGARCALCLLPASWWMAEDAALALSGAACEVITGSQLRQGVCGSPDKVGTMMTALQNLLHQKRGFEPALTTGTPTVKAAASALAYLGAPQGVL